MGASDSMEDNNFLTVPQTVTASSSAETLTGMYLDVFQVFNVCCKRAILDNTLTAPSTPTNISVQLLPVKNTNPTNPSGNPSGTQKDTNYTIRSPMRKKSSELSMPPYSDEPQVQDVSCTYYLGVWYLAVILYLTVFNVFLGSMYSRVLFVVELCDCVFLGLTFKEENFFQWSITSDEYNGRRTSDQFLFSSRRRF